MPQLATRSTSSETMDVDPIVLRETTTTRLIFCPSWVSTSDNPLRGGFVFQRKSRSTTWENFESISLANMHMNEEYKLNLGGDEVSMLLNSLDDINKLLIEHGHSYGQRVFELKENNAGGIFVQIGQIENRQWIVDELKKLEANNFENLGTALGRARIELAIEEIESNMSNDSESFWQAFFSRNTWVLQQVFAYPVFYLNGETYLGGKNSSGRNGAGGTATDFLLKHGSTGSFAVIEIKTPMSDLIGTEYRGTDAGLENQIFSMHKELSGGIVQMENQIRIAVEEFGGPLTRDYPGLNYLNPCGVLIIGKYDGLSDEQKRSFFLFRKSLGKNLVYTYDELLEKIKLLRGVYES